MQADQEKIAADLEILTEGARRGPLGTLRAYVKLSGPGWLQSAITLGGGSLASSLYLGVLAGYSMLWVQPLAMVMGIVMLSAIAYVALSTGERPFGAINRHINPVLGWSWAIATLMANMVWSLPQYSLATGVVEQNLAPGVLGPDGALGGAGRYLIVAAILVVTIAVTWAYDRGSAGVRLYERMLKIVVAAIVLCFVGVVVRLATAEDGLPIGEIAAGFVPDFGAFNRPAEAFGPFLAAVGDLGQRQFWTDAIVGDQRNVMIAAAATAVGINMTFLLPYTMLARGWSKPFAGLARFDLATGMLIPFLLATSCVVIASASRFHARPVSGLVVEDVSDTTERVPPGIVKNYRDLMRNALVQSLGEGGAAQVKALDPAGLDRGIAGMPVAERRLAAMLVKRDAFSLAKALRPLTNDFFANVLFGVGVLGMALSTITILMLISGFAICEMIGVPPAGRALRLGALAACSGALGPFFWSGARVYLAVPTSVFGMMLLPIAYWTFFLMMNSRRLLGDALPRGGARLAWNGLMLPAAGLATVAAVWSVWAQTGWGGLSCLGGLLGLALVVGLARRQRHVT